MPKKKRSPRSLWSRYELIKLGLLLSLYRDERINFDEIASHLPQRSGADVKRRWILIRDNTRRQMRDVLRSVVVEKSQDLPYSGELHPSLRWVETEWADLGGMDLA